MAQSGKEDRKEAELNVVVIGIGNLLRSDDGVGIHVVRRLKEERPDVQVVDLSTAELDILEHVRGRDLVFIIDAIITGAEPGTVHRLVPGNFAADDLTRSHGVGLSGVLQLGFQLYPGEMPGRIMVLGVEAGDIESFGCELTPKVEAAVLRVTEEILEEIEVTE